MNDWYKVVSHDLKSLYFMYLKYWSKLASYNFDVVNPSKHFGFWQRVSWQKEAVFLLCSHNFLFLRKLFGTYLLLGGCMWIPLTGCLLCFWCADSRSEKYLGFWQNVKLWKCCYTIFFNWSYEFSVLRRLLENYYF